MYLGVELCGLKLNNPTVLASGLLGVSRDMVERVIDNGAGAVTIKSVSFESREGHNNPTVIALENGLMNAVGYSNPGAEESGKEFCDLKKLKAPVIASVIGQEKGDFINVVKALEKCGFSMIEVPLSCPHTPGYGTHFLL